MFGDISDSDVPPVGSEEPKNDPHPISDSEMEVAVNDEAEWEDVLPASDEGPPISAKAPDGIIFFG